MCGIIGYVGSKEIIPILLEGLHSLEYRGYDSSGIAIYDHSNINVVKAVGKLSKLEEVLNQNNNLSNGKNGSLNCGIDLNSCFKRGILWQISTTPITSAI